MWFTRSKKFWALAAGSFVFVGAAAIAGSTYYNSNQAVEKRLPLLPQHADIPVRPILTYQDSLSQSLPSDQSALTQNCPTQPTDWVAKENANPGLSLATSDWHNLRVYSPTGSVLYVDKQSVTCGEKISIRASLYSGNRRKVSDHRPRSFQVIRIGWYGGSGGRMMWNSGPLKLSVRNVPTVHQLTRMIETKWPVTSTFQVGQDWAPGLYVVASVGPDGNFENLSPFILRSPPGSSKLALVHSTLTWAAYNGFGGRSTYMAPVSADTERSTVASMDRPLAGSGASHLDRDAIAFTQYIESAGFSVDHYSDVNIDQQPSLINNYGGLILSGHPEYMTRNEFDTFIAARNQGINLAIFGANTAYWQTRIAPSPLGPNRRIEIYRSAVIDPITEWNKVSIEFGDKRVNTRPSLITGERTAGVHVTGTLTAQKIPRWLSILPKSTLSGWPVNSEIDGAATGVAVPPTTHIIFQGKFVYFDSVSASKAPGGRSLVGQTIWFTSPSGAATFVAGINYWACELSYSCTESVVNDSTRAVLQSVTSQVLHLWQTKEIGKQLK